MKTIPWMRGGFSFSPTVWGLIIAGGRDEGFEGYNEKARFSSNGWHILLRLGPVEWGLLFGKKHRGAHDGSDA